jgi:Anti-anti-sigma regulatory factor (antagonist of anti-sigma factor)
MPMPGAVRVCETVQALEVQLEGCATMLHAQAMRQWIEANVARTPRIRIDLSRCIYMDSTFIGTLLGLKRLAESRRLGGLALVCPSPQCVQLLEQMRIGQVFATESSPTVGSTWQEVSVPADAVKTREFQCHIVEAHQRLADCPGPTGDRFRQLAEDMSRELKGKEADPRLEETWVFGDKRG